MSQRTTVKVSKRNQIAVPSEVRRRLGIESGDRLLVDVQDRMAILIPEPRDYARAMAGLHREVWQGIDTSAYLREERGAWQTSPED